MKRVAIVAHGLSNGGAERVAALLANNLSEKGYSVCFVAVYSPERAYELKQAVEYRYIDVRSKNRVLKLLNRSQCIDIELRKFKADTVISFIINELLISSIRKTAPIIYSMRNDPGHLLQSKISRFLCHFSYSRAKAIVFQTVGALKFFDYKIQEKGVIIGNPITDDLPLWRSSEHKKVIMTACRLNKQKNIPMLIKGFSEFYESHPEYQLYVYGEGELRQELEELCKELKIDNAVSFPGYEKNVHQVMAESSIFALTSDFEGLSNSMLEALAIGVPTVCTDCPPGGAREYIEDGINGFLVPINDSAMLCKIFNTIVDHRELQESLSFNSVKIRSLLDENQVVKKWIEIL